MLPGLPIPKERRVNGHRYKLVVPIPVQIHSDKEGLKDATINEVGAHGLFTSTDIQYPRLETIRLILRLPSDLGNVQFEAKVVHVQWHKVKKKKMDKGVGLHLQFESKVKKDIWQAYVLYLRNKTIIDVSKRIIEEFKEKPKV